MTINIVREIGAGLLCRNESLTRHEFYISVCNFNRMKIFLQHEYLS